MQPQTFQEMVNFILLAKRSCYVGGGKQLLPYRLGSHDLQFLQGDWAYHDSYLGESDFMGEEIVYYHNQVVWGLNYFGRILNPEKITSSQAGAVIQQSLTAMYQSGRFLGGFTHTVGEFEYRDANDGDPAYFTGKEQITVNGEVVYQLIYHGGIVKQ